MPRKKTDWEKIYWETAAEAERLAKRANQRMLRLERYSQQEQYKDIKQFAYRVAQKDIQTLYGKEGERLRFTEKQKPVIVKSAIHETVDRQEFYKANVMQLRAKIKAMKTFLDSASSTIERAKDSAGVMKEGLNQVWDSRTKKINEKYLNKYGLEFTSNDMRNFFASKKQSKLQTLVGSDSMFIVAAAIKKNNLASNKRDMARFIKNNLDLSGKIDEKQYEDAAAMYEDFKDILDLTGDPVLNDYITEAIRQGLNYKNIFIH